MHRIAKQHRNRKTTGGVGQPHFQPPLGKGDYVIARCSVRVRLPKSLLWMEGSFEGLDIRKLRDSELGLPRETSKTILGSQ